MKTTFALFLVSVLMTCSALQGMEINFDAMPKEDPNYQDPKTQTICPKKAADALELLTKFIMYEIACQDEETAKTGRTITGILKCMHYLFNCDWLTLHQSHAQNYESPLVYALRNKAPAAIIRILFDDAVNDENQEALETLIHNYGIHELATDDTGLNLENPFISQAPSKKRTQRCPWCCMV